jgi:hypothetical protein
MRCTWVQATSVWLDADTDVIVGVPVYEWLLAPNKLFLRSELSMALMIAQRE